MTSEKLKNQTPDLQSTSKEATEGTRPLSSETEAATGAQSSPSPETESTKTSMKPTKTKSQPGKKELDDKALAAVFRATTKLLAERGLIHIRIATKGATPMLIRVVLPLDKWTEDLELRDDK